MTTRIAGLHHVTALASDPQANIDFYTGLLGLELVKLTVNFDAPDVHHLYYGDAQARPGTILTFFPFVNAARGRSSAGMVAATAYAVPEAALDAWMERCAGEGLDFSGPSTRFGEPVIGFSDPDGLALEIVGSTAAEPGEALGRFHSVALGLARIEPTARLLSDLFGYRDAGEEAGRIRLAAEDGSVLDLVTTPETPRRPGAGTVHHVAFRARDDTEQAHWRERLVEAGFEVTDVKDRNYFRSIYFREPGGVLFEIATDGPGFAADEPPEALGRSLKLPAWLEPQRADIERRLPPVRLPK